MVVISARRNSHGNQWMPLKLLWSQPSLSGRRFYWKRRQSLPHSGPGVWHGWIFQAQANCLTSLIPQRTLEFWQQRKSRKGRLWFNWKYIFPGWQIMEFFIFPGEQIIVTLCFSPGLYKSGLKKQRYFFYSLCLSELCSDNLAGALQQDWLSVPNENSPLPFPTVVELQETHQVILGIQSGLGKGSLGVHKRLPLLPPVQKAQKGKSADALCISRKGRKELSSPANPEAAFWLSSWFWGGTGSVF